MFRNLVVLVLTCAAQLALAMDQTDRPLGADAFEAMSAGKTLRFTQNGIPYGAEQFFSGRTSIWQFADGRCTHGFWYPEAGNICFVYEHYSLPQCWVFSERAGERFARIAGLLPGDPSELMLSQTDEEPLDCPAPDLGV